MDIKKFFIGRAVGFVIILVLVYLITLVWRRDQVEVNTPVQNDTDTTTSISITSQDFTEKNFSGSRSVITGSAPIAVHAREYIEDRIAEFKKNADNEVPERREKFGVGSPPATYEIDINAKIITSPSTESIVLDIYEYIGGANGHGGYKVFTQTKEGDEILSLEYLIKEDQEKKFTSYVQKKLIDWRPEGIDYTIVFLDDVNSLNFASFSNWALDNNNLVLYFDEYSIGPGLLGEIEFPIPLSELKNFLN